MIKHKINIIILLFFLAPLSLQLFAQVKKVDLIISAGMGEMKGNSPNVTALNLSVGADAVPEFYDKISFRIGFLFSKKIEYYLPENSYNRYYPYLLVFSLKAFHDQKIEGKLFLEYGAGMLLINDRTFSDVDLWLLGAGFNLLAGIDFRENNTGFKLGVGSEYGSVFSGSNALYYSIYLQSSFSF